MSLLIFLFILGILIIVHEFGHFIAARRLGVKVEKFSLGFGPKLLSRQRNDTEWKINIIPLGGYVKMAGDNREEYKGNKDEYLGKSPAKRAAIIFFGPLLNYILGIVFLWVIFFAGYPSLTAKVGAVIEGYGAEQAGIRAGDRIISIDGKEVKLWEELQKEVKDKADKSVLLGVLRGNEALDINVIVKPKDFTDVLGRKQTFGLLGITPSDEIVAVRHGVFQAAGLSIKKTAELTISTYAGLWQMITGKLSVRESVTGPLGIFYITSKAASIGVIAVLHLLAVLSISLSIFNLLPLPVLDGGHIVLLLFEKIRGKGLGIKAEQIIQQVGFSLIVAMALFVTYNDIMRFFGEKISKIFHY